MPARGAPQPRDVFEPATVVDRFDIASNTQCWLPPVFDLGTISAEFP
ncbi:MAG TPA: hypothetical protein VLF18_19580 [Tahibacter sp.]|nr:hypothetical protein [Tahibacter sp.]HSX62392.1 hypothetical protein [Tahibacter sp.]